jgi:hypothetical protein
MDTIRMVWRIRPDHLSTSFFTPTPGSNIAKDVERKGLTMVDPFNSSCRTPNEAKLKDLDYDWLNKAMRLAHAGGTEAALVALGRLPMKTQESACMSR